MCETLKTEQDLVEQKEDEHQQLTIESQTPNQKVSDFLTYTINSHAKKGAPVRVDDLIRKVKFEYESNHSSEKSQNEGAITHSVSQQQLHLNNQNSWQHENVHCQSHATLRTSNSQQNFVNQIAYVAQSSNQSKEHLQGSCGVQNNSQSKKVLLVNSASNGSFNQLVPAQFVQQHQNNDTETKLSREQSVISQEQAALEQAFRDFYN